MRVFSLLFLLSIFLCSQSGWSAMRLSQDGRGEVLIFPFYSALDDDRTLITISNSTGYVKGVSVNVREGLIGGEALGWHV